LIEDINVFEWINLPGEAEMEAQIEWVGKLIRRAEEKKKMEERVGDVQVQLKELEVEVADLSSNIGILAERLNSILGLHEEENPNAEKVSRVAVCDLSQAIQIQRDKVHKLLLAVQIILNRLEI